MMGMHMGMARGAESGDGDEGSESDGCRDGDEDEGCGWRWGCG